MQLFVRSWVKIEFLMNIIVIETLFKKVAEMGKFNRICHQNQWFFIDFNSFGTSEVVAVTIKQSFFINPISLKKHK